MKQKLKIINIVLALVWCLSIVVSVSEAAISDQDVAKIEKALPKRPTVRPAKPRKLLVFNLCKGFKHGSIPYIDKALVMMGEKTGAYQAVVSSNMVVFEAENLNKYDAVCFNNTTRLGFENENLRKSLMDFIKGGKGIIGIHAATDNFYKWPEAQEMMGGKFTGHPWGGGGTWAIKIDEPDHPLTAAFKGKGFKIKDEIYRTDPPLYSRQKQLVLMSLDMTDEKTRNVKGFKPPDEDTGISWIKTWGKGRMFYCSLGHNPHIAWDPAVLQHYLDGIQFALGDYKVDTKPRSVGSLGKGTEMEELFGKVKQYDYGKSRAVLTEVSNMIRDAYGSPQKLKQIEKNLTSVLRAADATPAARQFVCRKLSVMGSDASVPTLAAMLTKRPASKQEPHPADMARYALERIPGSSADSALRNALSKTNGTVKVGIINTLGERGDEKSVSAMSRLINDSDKTVAGAAVAALGKIGGSDATKALAAAKDKTSGKMRMLVLDAYLQCAEKLVAQGNKIQALAIYRELYKKNYPQVIRTAAMRGMVGTTGAGRK